MAKIEKPENIQIGQWWTYCCHLDLWRINSEDEVVEVTELLADPEPPRITLWTTKREALLEIREGWKDKDALREIDELLALGEVETESYTVKEGGMSVTHFQIRAN